MLPAIASLFLRHRSPALQLAHRATVLATIVVALGTSSACSKESTSPAGNTRTYGPALALGQGTARTFVTTDQAGTPKTLGVALSEAAMTGLPQMPMPGMPSGAMLVLQLPAAAVNTGFDHVMLDWNPAGHEPEHVYTLPHFDFHFYQITSAVRESIMPTNPEWATKSGAFPTAEYIPAGYVAGSVLAGVPAPAAAVPMMGMHWLDVASGELQPPPNNKTFTSTFIYGTWDGTFIFLEPMITKAYIESMKDKPAGIILPIGVAQKVQKAGAYPNAYSITYDATAKEYRITLEGLATRQ
ncbi:MAG: DUF5602 domain-containing protein [Cytophagaceae bacterium]|nr:DUF5602 domain-containing protein [Gemmatimonadaceae bacterium]